MERFIEQQLLVWKESTSRKPLLLLGARQCGKTYTLKRFGEDHFKKYAYFDFSNDNTLQDLFWNLDVQRLIRDLSVVSDVEIDADTLIIFDEIQECRPALTSLKYFCQDAPEYCIVGAGSLLGVALKDETPEKRYPFPVGKVEFMNLHPMCFGEYILVRQGKDTFEYLRDLSPKEMIPEGLMSILDRLFVEYLTIGGMPEAVSTWCETEDLSKVRKTQSSILLGYMRDIGTYCKENYGRVTAVWDSAAEQLGEANDRFVFKKAHGTVATLSESISWLINADILRLAKEVNSDRIPQRPRGDAFIKLYYSDVGLLSYAAKLSPDFLSKGDSTALIRGALVENFVLNELSVVLDDNGPFYYWRNEKGQAEIDFQLMTGSGLIPIEVKSGKIGRLQSLGFYCSKYAPEGAFVFSRENVRVGSKTEYTFVPLYMLWRFKDYAHAAGITIDLYRFHTAGTFDFLSQGIILGRVWCRYPSDILE